MKSIYQWKAALAAVALGAAALALSPAPQLPQGEPELQQLMEGNRRFARLMAIHPDQTSARRFSVATAQHPFATVLTCADSRVPPEIVFDQGLGDLFVIRVAGNIVDDAVLGSIEYAAEHLQVPLVVVLGHERCGAVEATLKGGKVHGHLGALTRAIQPAVEHSRRQPGDPLDNAVRANIRLVVSQLRASKPPIKVKMVGARYDLDTGVVELLP
jgi:carbonic anhydrase